MRMELSDPRYKAWVVVNQLVRVISKARARESRSSGLTPAQFGVIWAIKTTSRVPTSAEIGRMLLRKPQAMTGLIRRMEASGLVTRDEQSGRGEGIAISITEKGENAYQQAAYSDILPDAFSCLDEAELAQLLDLLTRVRDQATNSVASKYAVDIANLI